jgi:hypothetical protein
VLLGHHTAQENERFLFAGGNFVAHILYGFPLTNFTRNDGIHVRQHGERVLNCSRSREKADLLDPKFAFAHDTDSSAGLELLFKIRCQSIQCQWRKCDSCWVVPGPVFRPAQCIRKPDGERVRYALTPVIAESPNHETIRLNEVVFRSKNLVRGSRRAPASRGRRRVIGSRVERRLAGDHEVCAGAHGLFEHVHGRHRGCDDAFYNGGRIACFECIDRVRFPLNADLLPDAIHDLLCCNGRRRGSHHYRAHSINEYKFAT